MMHPRAAASTLDRRQCQRGAYAIEFALVFLIFFLAVYAILTYGLIFMAQQSMNRAVNTGGRALLSWSAQPQDRAANACAKITDENTWWIGGLGNADALTIQIQLPPGYGAGSTTDCTVDNIAATDTATILLTYDYQGAPLIPTLGFGSIIGLPVPATLTAQAQVDLGVAYPGTPAEK